MTATAELLAAAVLLVGGVAVWIRLWRRREADGSLVPYEPRRPVPWDLPALGLVMLLFWLRMGMLGYVDRRVVDDPKVAVPLQEMVERKLASMPNPSEQDRIGIESSLKWVVGDYARRMFQAAAATQLLEALIVAVVLQVVCRPNRDDYGISTQRLGVDLRLGIVGFFALAVPALLLQGLLQWLFVESQHPIVLAFKNSADGSAFLWATVAAVVVAPVAEEFLFRGVLQGMFERIWGERTDSTPPNDLDSPPAATNEVSSFAPVFISAAIFALMHLSSGIDVVPLFFLALGLGYLYRQTHRLWPGIVVHTLLNAFSMAMLLLQAK